MKLGKSNWATKDKQFKVMEKQNTFIDGKEYTIERGTLRVYGKYYRVTERVGQGIMNYTRELNMKYRMGLIDENEYLKLRSRLISDLETKRVGLEDVKRGFDVGRTSVFFENLMQKAGISDKLFKPENLSKMTNEQRKTIEQFKRNMKKLENNQLLQQSFYDEVSLYYKNLSQFYELQKAQGGKLTEQQIEDMVGTIENLNKKYKQLTQQKLSKYV